MPIIEIPGLGNIEFPEAMSHDEINDAIKNNIMPTIRATQPSATSVGVPEVAPTPSAVNPNALIPQSFEGVASEKPETNIADALKNYLVKPIADTFGTYDESAKHPYLTSAATGIINAKNVYHDSAIQNLTELIEAKKEQYGPNFESAPKDELKVIQQTQKDIQGHLNDKAQNLEDIKATQEKYSKAIPTLSKKIDALESTPLYQKASKIEQFQLIGKEIVKNPSDIPEYISHVGLESLPTTLPMLIAAAASGFVGGPGAAMMGGGATSAFTEFGSEYVQLRQEGKSHEEATAQAATKSGVIGYFDAISFGSAGKALEKIMNNVGKGAWQIAKGTAKEVGKETGKQALLGASGEGVGSIVSGQPVNPRSVIEEAIGEVAGAPLEAVTTYRGNVKEAQQAQELKDLKDKLAGLSEEKPAGEKEPPTKTPPTEPTVRTVTQDQLMGHATTRLAELDAKANGVPAKETVDENGNKITIPEVPAQPMTEQETAELKFLQDHMGNPERLAQGYGVQIGEAKPVGSHDTEAALGELEGKEMPVPPIFQQPAEPAKPVEPETPPTEEAPEVPPEEQKPPTEEKKPVIKDSKGVEHDIPTVADAEKAGFEFFPINRDKPMYAKTDLEGVMRMINNLFGGTTYRSNMTSSSYKVTSNKNKVLPKTSNKNQVSVTFRPDTLSGRQIGDDEFLSDDTAHKAIESFTIHNPGRLKVKGDEAVAGTSYLDQFFTRGNNPDGSITYTLRRTKSSTEKANEKEELSKEYLEHINAPRGKLKHNYKRLRKAGLNSFQQIMDKHTKLGDALKEILTNLEQIVKDGILNAPDNTMPFAVNLKNEKQAEMYIDIIKHLMKIEPVMKTNLFMDPYVIGGRNHTVPGFYNRVTNNMVIFANGYIDTFIHEAIHAATVHYIKTHPNDAKVQKLEKILAASRKNDVKTKLGWGRYGNTDLMEFIAEAFSNPNFIEHLSKMDPIFDKETSPSLFDNVKSIVRGMMKALGVNVEKDRTAFDEVMDLSSELFTGKTLEGYIFDKGHPLDAETLNIDRPIEREFSMDDIPKKDDETFTIPSGTEIFHGSHGSLANEILKNGSILKSKTSMTSSGGLTSEGGLIWFADKNEASLYAKSERDYGAVASYERRFGKREPGKVFVTVTNKPLKIIGTNYKLTRDEAKKLNEALGLPEYKYLKKGDDLRLAETRAVVYRQSNIERYTNARGEQIDCPWPVILETLGYDGIYHETGIGLNLNQIQASRVLEATEENLSRIESNVAETLNVQPMDEATANVEAETRGIFNYLGDPIDIRKWEIPEQGPIAARLSKWFQEFADEHVILTKVSNAIRSLNRTISDMSDMEKKQELKNSRISDQLLRFANEEVNPILKQMLADGVSMDDIKQYLHARHAEAYNNRMNDLNHRVDAQGNIIPYGLKDRASGMSTQDANDYLNGLSEERERVLKNIADKWYAIRDKTQQILVDSGQETQETIDLWNEIFPDYIPLNREQEQQAVPTGLRTGVGIDTRGNFSKRAMGSEKAIINPIDALLYQRERAVARAENNEVGKSVYRLALENPNPDFWLPINPDAIRSREKLIQELEDMGYQNAEEIADNIMAEPKERYLRPVRPSDFVIDPTTGLPIPNGKEVVDARISRNARFGDNVLTLKINGRERYVFFNQKDPNAVTMVRTLKNLDSQTLGRFLTANRFMNHYLGQVYTVLNPIFGIVNGIRDFPFGMANLSTTPIKGKQAEVSKKIFPAMMGIMSVLRKERAGDGTANSEWQRIYKEATEAGFQTSNRYAILNTGEDQTYIEQTLKGFTDNNAKQMFRYIINMTYDFASMIENGVRLAAYQQMREEGYTPQQSASVAKNLTINFDKKGSRTAALRSLYLFFNASIRGTVRLAETLKGPAGAKIIGGGVLLGVMQAMLIAGAGFKDDDPPEYIRERNLIIPTGDGKYITLPMPYGLNILPNTGRILTEAAIDINKNGFKKAKLGKKSLSWANSFLSTFSPFGNQGLTLNALVPSAVEPFAGVFLTNKNSFGQTISKQDSYTRPTPGYMRTKESGTAAGKEFARWMNLLSGGTDYTKGVWSPTGDDIDFLASSFTGPVVGSVAKTAKYIKAKVAGEEVPAYQVPVAGRFMGEIDSKPVITSRFYNNINAMYEHELTLKNLKGDPEATRKYIQDHPDARAYKRAEHVESQINGLNAKKKKFQMRGAPQEALQRIDNQKIIIMNRFNDQLERIRSQ